MLDSPRKPLGIKKKLLLPHVAFAILGTLFGLVFLVVTPPFQVADEPAHFYRAFQVSELHIFRALEPPEHEQDPLPRALLPRSLAATVDSTGFFRIRFNPHEKADIGKILSLFHVHLDPHARELLRVAPYSPLAYIPQAIGVALGRAFNSSPLHLLYIGRVFALMAWIFLMYLSIKTTPILKWIFFLLALMPMTVFQGASNSADSSVLGVSFLVIATFLECALGEKDGTLRRQQVYLASGLLIVLVLSKPGYFALVVLYFLIPLERFRSKKEYFLTFAVMFIAGIVLYFLSGFISDVSPGSRRSFVLSDPTDFFKVLANTVVIATDYYLSSFVGQLGWLDTYLPRSLIYSYLSFLFVASVFEGGEKKFSYWARLLTAGVFLLVVVTTFAFFYINWHQYFMQAVQGRYFIPVAPLLLLLFYNRRVRIGSKFGFKLVVIAFCVFSLSVAAYALTKRYYHKTPPSYQVEQITLNNTGDTYIIKGWIVDERSQSPPLAVSVEIDGMLYQA